MTTQTYNDLHRMTIRTLDFLWENYKEHTGETGTPMAHNIQAFQDFVLAKGVDFVDLQAWLRR